MSDADEEEPLDVDMSGTRGTKGGVAAVLDSTARFMHQMPDGARFDFELSITEVSEPPYDGEDGEGRTDYDDTRTDDRPQWARGGNGGEK